MSLSVSVTEWLIGRYPGEIKLHKEAITLEFSIWSSDISTHFFSRPLSSAVSPQNCSSFCRNFSLCSECGEGLLSYQCGLEDVGTDFRARLLRFPAQLIICKLNKLSKSHNLSASQFPVCKMGLPYTACRED